MKEITIRILIGVIMATSWFTGNLSAQDVVNSTQALTEMQNNIISIRQRRTSIIKTCTE